MPTKSPSRLSEAVSARMPAMDTRRKNISLLDDINATATALSSDLGAVLAERLDDLDTNHHLFRTGLHRAFVRILTLAQRQSDKPAMIFEEAVPGFSVILYKKVLSAQVWAPAGQESVLDDPRQSPEMAASAMLIEAFVARTNNRVVVIESPDAVFVFFPASDLRRNVKEMGYYHTD